MHSILLPIDGSEQARQRVSRILCKRRLITAEAFFPQTE